MLDSSLAFADVIEGNDIALDWIVTLTLPDGSQMVLTKAVEEVLIEEEDTTSLPDGLQYQSGTSATGMTVTVSGMLDLDDEDSTPDQVFGPWQKDSVLYRQSLTGLAITADLGVVVDGQLASETLRRFTGVVDDFDLDDTGRLVLTCIDRRNTLRSVASLPAVVTVAPYNAGLTNEFAMDALLRAASAGKISSWPAQRAQCVLAAGMRSSLWPEVGSLNTTYTQGNPVFSPGPYGSGLSDIDVAATTLAGAVYNLKDAAAFGTNSLYMEFLISGVTTSSLAAVSLGQFVTFGGVHRIDGPLLGVSDTGITFVDGGTEVWSVAIDDQVHRVRLAASFNPATGNWSGTMMLDTTSHTFTGVGGTTPAGYLLAQVTRPVDAVIAGVQITNDTAPPDLSDVFAPQAILDPSLNPLQVVPAISGDPWPILQEMAESEAGLAGFDTNGIFRFRNRVARRGGIFGRTVSVASSLKGLGFKNPASLRRNRIQIPTSSWTFSARKTVWTASSVIKVGAKSTRRYQVVLSTDTDPLVGALAVTDSGILPDGGGGDGRTYWRACADPAGVTAVSTGISVRVFQTTSSQFTVLITNTSGSPRWMVSPTGYSDMNPGTPCLVIGGIAVTPGDTALADVQWPTVEEGGAASDIANGGENATTLDANPYWQDLDAQTDYAWDLLCTLRRPPPIITQLSIVTDPRLVKGDRVRLVYPSQGIDDDVVIVNNHIDWSQGSDGSHIIDARPVAKPGGWVLGVPGKCELGVNTYV